MLIIYHAARVNGILILYSPGSCVDLHNLTARMQIHPAQQPQIHLTLLNLTQPVTPLPYLTQPYLRNPYTLPSITSFPSPF
jgi:hypothetical protein